MEYKAAPTEFKASGDQGVYEGYFSIKNNVDDGMDVIYDGAFMKTLQERSKRIKVFMGHDWSKLIGPPPEIIQEDSKGLYAKGRLTLGSFWGKETWELMKDNALTEGSIGFEVFGDKIEYLQNGVRGIKEVKLYEISPVPLGMNPLTEVQAIKAFSQTGDPELIIRWLAEFKAGARHSTKDIEALNKIHDMVLELGATNCKSAAPDEEQPLDTQDSQKAAPPALVDYQRRIRAAELALVLKRIRI